MAIIAGNPQPLTRGLANSLFLQKSNNLSDVASRQTALNTLTDVAGATIGHVLTKSAGGDAVFEAAAGVSWPASENDFAVAQDSVDAWELTFDLAALTANRALSWPDAAGTPGLLERAQTWSGNQTISNGLSGFQQLLTISSTDTSGVSGAARMVFSHQNSSFIINAYSPGAPGALTNSVGFFASANTNKLVIGHTGTSSGQDVQFFTDDAFTAPQVTLTQSGRLIVGTTVAFAKVHFAQASATGAIPVLTLGQVDVDEDFIYFIGTSSAATTDRSLIKPADFPTPGAIVAWLKCKIQDLRVGGIGTIDAWIPAHATPTV